MRSSCLGKLVLNLFITGCAIFCYSVCVRATDLTYVDDTTIIEEINEGDNITIDCTTAESAYYTALYLSHEPIPSFFLVPNGKKLIKMGQSFTVTNLTQQDAGDYGCIAMDKNYYFTVISKATYYIRSPPKPKPLENKTVVKTASMKLSGSKPYLYFKVKSPLRISMIAKEPFNLTVSVKGLQPIKLQWHKDLHVLVIGSRYKTFDNGRRLLVESPFTEEDSGTYSASACNTRGCEVRGVQVLFYTMPNTTFIKKDQDDDQGEVEVEGEGFIGDWVKKYGILGIPLVLAIILITAIICSTGSKEEKKEKILDDLMYKVQDREIKKYRGQGRTASVWNWHSEGESSPDEMPDYDRIKSKKKTRRCHSMDMENDEFFDMDEHEGDREGTEHYGQQQYYSDEEPETDRRDGVYYKTEEDRRYRPKQTTNFNSGADDVGSQQRYDHDEQHSMTKDSHHGVTTHSKDSDAPNTVEEESLETMLSSFFGYMKHQAKRIETFVSKTENPPAPTTENTDTQVTRDTVVKESQVMQQTAANDTQVTQDKAVDLPQVMSDMVAEDTEVTQDAVGKHI